MNFAVSQADQTGKSSRNEAIVRVGLVHFVRIAYRSAAWLFAACIILQVYFAGLGLLVNASYWSMHIIFGEQIAFFFPLIMMMLAIVGRLPVRLIALTALLIFLYYLQWVFLYTPIQIGSEQLLRALHPVNALALFWLTLHLAQRSRGY